MNDFELEDEATTGATSANAIIIEPSDTQSLTPAKFTPTPRAIRTPKIGFDITALQEPIKKPEDEQDVWEGISATVRRNELFYNNFLEVSDTLHTLSEFHSDMDAVRDFDPLAPFYINQVPKHWQAQMQRTSTPGEFYRKLTKLQIEAEDQETIAKAGIGTTLAGGFVAGATNPLYWIPLAQGLRLPSTLKAAGMAAAKTAPKILALETLTEIDLSTLQENRTMQESASNILTTTFLGGIFAGVGGGARALKVGRYRKIIQAGVEGETVKFGLNEKGEVTHFNIYPNEGGSVGAAKVRRLDLKGETLYGHSKGKEYPSLPKERANQIKDAFMQGLGRKPNKMERYVAGEIGPEAAIKISQAADDTKISDILPHETYRGRFDGDDTVADLFAKVDAEFGSHYNAATPAIWFTGTFARNPVILALTGKSAYAARFVNDMFEHNFDITRNVVRGENLTIPMQTRLNKYRAIGFSAERLVNKSYSEYLKHFKKLGLTDVPEALRFPQYVKQLYYPIVTGKPHADGFINSISNKLNETYFKPLTEELIAVGALPKDIKPKAAAGYINRLYDRDFMSGNRKFTLDFFESEFTKTREKVIEASQATRELKEAVAHIKDELKDATDPRLQSFLNKLLKSTQRRLLKAKNLEYFNMEMGKYTDDMVVGKKGMDITDRKKLTNLRKPIKKMKSAIRDEEARLRVAKSEKQTKEALKLQEAQLEKAKQELRDYRASLIEDRDAGLLPDSFFRGEYLRKPDKGTLAFRPILDDTDLKRAAKDMYDNIMGMSESTFADAILNANAISDGGGENPFKSRGNMIMDEALYDSGIMQTDIRKNITAFANRAGKVIEMRKYLGAQEGYGPTREASKYLAEQIKTDFEILHAKLDQKFAHKKEGLSGDALAKVVRQEQRANQKLIKEEKLSRQVVSETYGRIMGSNGPKNGRLIRTARFFNNWAYSTQMGALALLGVQDFVAPIFRIGPTAWLRHGPVALVTNMLKFKHADNVRLKQSAADIGVGCELATALYAHQFHIGSDLELPMNFGERAMANASSLMGVVNGSTALSDFSNFVATTAIQSNVVRRLHQLVDGTISKSDAQMLRGLGIGDVKIAKQLLGYTDKFGEKLSGAFLPNWNNWASTAANAAEKRLALESKDIFQAAVMKQLRSTIFSGGNIATLPLGLTPGGFNKSVLIYMGWMFNATSNYLIPALQQFDKNRVAGVAAMIGAAYIVAPMREMASGKEPNLDFDYLTKKAILNSGVGGIVIDAFNRINSMGKIFPELLTDRYESKGLDISAGMPWTAGKAVWDVVGMATQDDWNQKQLENVIKVIPMAWAIQFRLGIKKALGATGLKERPER